MESRPVKTPSAKAKTMSPFTLVGRLLAAEAMLLVLAEAYLDRQDVDDEKGRALLKSMRESAKELAHQLGRPEVTREADQAVDGLIEVLITNLPAMKGEFGTPRARRGQ